MSLQRERRYERTWNGETGSRPVAPDVDESLATAEDAVGRRDFLRLAGFTAGAVTLVGCSRGTERGVMPYLVRPEETTPGRAYEFATVCGGCPAACGVLVKCRDGRPLKLEGNPDHPLSRGGLCATGQASVLALYDSRRLRRPVRDGKPATWAEVDAEVARGLEAARARGGRVRVLTDSATGPAEREAIASFLSSFKEGRHVVYDPLSTSAIAGAHARTHGIRAIPRYRFERAQVVVAFAADFLGTWISPVEHTAGYRAARRLDAGADGFSWHVQVESRMSLTGSNADRRVVVPPGSSGAALTQLVRGLASTMGAQPARPAPEGPLDSGTIRQCVERLLAAPRGRTLVVCGENDLAAQIAANGANQLLGNYEGEHPPVDLGAGPAAAPGDDVDLAELLREIAQAKVDVLLVRGVNPVYDLPGGSGLAAALDRVPLVLAFAETLDETARHARLVCPEPHFLESWGDAESAVGIVSLRQPAIRGIGEARPLLESLATWSGRPEAARDRVRESWRRRVHPRREGGPGFDEFWNQALHDGFARVRPERRAATAPFDAAAAATAAPWRAPASDAFLLDLHASPGILDGRHAHNPWLHEVPDPIAKTVWDNFAAVAPAAASALGLATGDVVRIAPRDGGDAIELPVLVQPGQHRLAIAIGLGYGRAGTDRFAAVGPQWWEGRPTVAAGAAIGTNAAPLIAWTGGYLSYAGRVVRVEKTGRRHVLARTQEHHALEVPAHLAAPGQERRPIVRETTLVAWRQEPASGNESHHDLSSLWPEHPKRPHHWGLAIDLSACTGCSACVVACQAENNVPVVGKDEVRRAREMHWMRIDRYYAGEGDDLDVVHMPMLCQHCDNAPCETVCPVQATAQSAEGLNQQVYNRCVGTRYCANNCPYKVRRFNWFHYPREDRLQNLALNPEVTVRDRGVMEKCSLCVQRIHEAKAEAKREARAIRDGDIRPACAQSCPAGAIVFGDMNDPESRVSRLKHDPRHYAVLAELGLRPVVGYLTRVRNRGDA